MSKSCLLKVLNYRFKKCYFSTHLSSSSEKFILTQITAQTVMIYVPKFEESSLSPGNNTDIHNNFSLPLATWHVITIYYTLKVLLGLLGNSLVLHAFLYPDLLDYKKVSLVILTNLAVADFLVLLVMGLPTPYSRSSRCR